MSNAPNPVAPARSSRNAGRSVVEKVIVWGGILLLLAVVGIEGYAKYSYTSVSDTLNQRLNDGDAKGLENHLTDADVKRIVGGKQPEISGKTFQLKIPARMYEVYVWRSLLKQNWTPPEPREEIDIDAAYSGQVRPDLLPENIKKLRLSPEVREKERNLFSAYVLYVYYSVEDPKTKVREVVSVRDSREPYQYEENPEPNVYIAKLPDDVGLKQRHDNMMALHAAGMAKSGLKVTQEALDAFDPWKNPNPKYLKGASSSGSPQSPAKQPDPASKP